MKKPNKKTQDKRKLIYVIVKYDECIYGYENEIDAINDIKREHEIRKNYNSHYFELEIVDKFKYNKLTYQK